MRQGTTLRFLELLARELGAVDARAELGGRDPDDPCIVWCSLPSGFRLVAVFAAPLAAPERAHRQRRLEQLAQGFSHTLGEVSLPPPSVPPPESAFRRLDAALEALRSRAGGVGVVVVDVQSPVLWGSSEPSRHTDNVEAMVEIGQALQATLEAGVELDAICALQAEDVPTRLRDLGVDPAHATLIGRALVQRDDTAMRHHLLICLAVARTRREAELNSSLRWAHHEPQFGYFARSFANIYQLVVVFEGAFSELYVESAVVHALPSIEHLLLALPPLDPDPIAKRGRVIPLRR
jgi:hypothetical protein